MCEIGLVPRSGLGTRLVQNVDGGTDECTSSVQVTRLFHGGVRYWHCMLGSQCIQCTMCEMVDVGWVHSHWDYNAHCGGKSVQCVYVWGYVHVCAWVHWWNLTQLLCEWATDVTMPLNLAQGPAFSNWRCKLASFPGSPQRKMYTTAQLQCLHSRPEEPGDEVRWYGLIPRPRPASSCFHSWMGRAWEQGCGDPAFPVLYNSSFFFFSAE